MTAVPETAAGVVLARPDVSVLRTGEGVWVGVGAASFTVKGGAAFDLVSMLLGRADGSRAGGALVEEFPEAARPAAARLLGALVRHGCVTLLREPLSRHTAGKGPAARWLIPQFAQLTGDPVGALDRLLATPLLLYGRPAWLAGLRAVFDATPLHGPRVEYRTAPGEPPPADGDRTGLVVVDADALPHAEVVRVQDALLARGVPHGVAGTVGGRYWTLWSDGSTTGCWDCLCRYGRARERERDTAAAPAPVSAVAASLAHAVQTRAAGLDTGAAVSVDPDALTAKPHPVWPLAGCRCPRATRPPADDRPRPAGALPRPDAGSLVRRDIASPHDDPRLQDDNDRIVAALAAWTDDLIGPFLTLDGGDAPQVPFGRAQAAVLVDEGGDTARVREVHAATLSSREALYQAALNAFELLAARPAGPGARAVGAGWTRDEALYRALLRRTLRLPHDDGASAPFLVDDLGDDECARAARYLAGAVARATDRPPLQWTGSRLPNGLHRAAGHDGAGTPVTDGLGACRAEAVCAALLRLVNDPGVLVAVQPHFATWPEVWRHVAEPDGAVSLRHAVPFTDDLVHLVEVA
ncbi:hypothetical protein [Streptomyces griseosporeus]|uniref:hypothetical protein n=1 Tax=Streptomyces griseosporeus TaxID=1910 RepID=UPI0036F55759